MEATDAQKHPPILRHLEGCSGVLLNFAVDEER